MIRLAEKEPCDSREEVDAMVEAAASPGGTADIREVMDWAGSTTVLSRIPTVMFSKR